MPTLPFTRELTCTCHYFSISNIARVGPKAVLFSQGSSFPGGLSCP